MSYIQQSLGDGETIIARARFPWFYSLKAWTSLLVPLIVLIGAAAWVNQRPDPFTTDNPTTWGLVLIAAWLLLGFITFVGMMVRRATTEIGVTSHRFVDKKGAVSTRTNEIALPNIEGVKMEQSLFGRIFGYGTVRIEGTGIDAVTTPTIADPVGFVRAIQTAKEHQIARQP